MQQLDPTKLEKLKKKTERCFDSDFNYLHRNPYHDKLGQFGDIILRDHEGEEFKGRWNKDVFRRDAPLKLEVGSGHGHFMLDYCRNHPQHNFIGIDYRFKRSYKLAGRLAKSELENFRYLRARGERITHLFDKGEVDDFYYFFPDPWPKARHHKKRLFQERFLQDLHRVLKPGGRAFVKTDHEGLYHWMMHFLKHSPFEVLLATSHLRREYPEHYLSSFTTRFEHLFLDKGLPIYGLVFQKRPLSPNVD